MGAAVALIRGTGSLDTSLQIRSESPDVMFLDQHHGLSLSWPVGMA
jgi:hypothetical protein